MDELKAVKAAVHPNEILLVVDAMTGQDAVNAASAFDEALGIDGVAADQSWTATPAAAPRSRSAPPRASPSSLPAPAKSST